MIYYCNKHRRADFLIDCVEANRGALLPDARDRVWKTVSWLFVNAASIRMRLIDKLPHMTCTSRRELLRQGLERYFCVAGAAQGEHAVEAFVDGVFGVKLWRRLQSEYRTSNSDFSPAKVDENLSAAEPFSSDVKGGVNRTTLK